MATIPSVEEVLLEIHQSLGLDPIQSTVKEKIANLGYSIATQEEKVRDLIVGVFEALDMDGEACGDAFSNIFEWAAFHKEVVVHTWTSNADQRQVLWHLLGYSYAPALGRRTAYWNADGAFDRGMPGGLFWFLPVVDTQASRIRLPVPQVVDWLLDLLSRPMDAVKDQLGGARANRVGNHESIERNLYNWRKGKVPSPSKIREYFPDDAAIDFEGVFELQEEASDEAKFAAALAFVRDLKGLAPDGLRDQIPMTQPGRLEAIFEGSAPADEKRRFVEMISTRYGRPSMRTIRQRFRAASMVQDGYQRLLKLLCPGVDELCPDPKENKLLQITGIFQATYNLTITSLKHCNTLQEADAWLEDHLPPLDRVDLFQAIVPSGQRFAAHGLARLLTRRFATLPAGAPLEDFVGLDQGSAREVAERRLERVAKEFADDRRQQEVVERMRRSSPWRALQGENDYLVVGQIAQTGSLPARSRQMAVERMRELAANPNQVLGATVIELHELLNVLPKERPKDVRQRVESLLESAKGFEDQDQWRAPLLQYEAKHRLAQNDFQAAGKLFRQALDACSTRNYGRLRGEIARDLFATEVAGQKLIPGSHEKYYRNMLAFGIFESEVPPLEDTAVWVADYFWTDLYKPYPGVQRLSEGAVADAENVLAEALRLIELADWDRLRSWFHRNAKVFRKRALREVRGDTVLLLWLKMIHAIAGLRSNVMASDHATRFKGFEEVHGLLGKWKIAVELLLNAWPEQVNLPDFKGQTPLMLIADAGDEVLTSEFVAGGADVNAQDYKGRTPLHAAVTSRSEECVAAILAGNPDVRRTTVTDRQSVLHTAVRMGQTKVFRAVLEHDPGLKDLENTLGQTPRTLVEDILANLPNFESAMAKQLRQFGTRRDYELIASILRDEATIH